MRNDQKIRMAETSKLNRRYFGIALIVIAITLSAFLFFKEAPTPVKKVSVVQPVKVEKTKKAQVKLKVYVTACQKIKVTIPLDAGIVTQSDDMRVAKGYVENIGDVPVQFVQVQIIWKDKKDKSIDASTTFAVSDEVLAPGERASFQTSKRNYQITRCNARVIDWWVVDKTAYDKQKAADAEDGKNSE